MIDTTETRPTDYMARGRYPNPTTKPVPDALPDVPDLGANLGELRDCVGRTLLFLEAAQARNAAKLAAQQAILDTPLSERGQSAGMNDWLRRTGLTRETAVERRRRTDR